MFNYQSFTLKECTVYQKDRTLQTSGMVTLQGNGMLSQQRSVAAVSAGSWGVDISTSISQHASTLAHGPGPCQPAQHPRARQEHTFLGASAICTCLLRDRNPAQRKWQPFLWPEAGLFTMHDLDSKVHTGIQPTHPPASYLFSAQKLHNQRWQARPCLPPTNTSSV